MSDLKLFIRACDSVIRFAHELDTVLTEDLSAYEITIYQEELKDSWSKVKSTYDRLLTSGKTSSATKKVDSADESEADDLSAESVSIQKKYSGVLRVYARCMSRISIQIEKAKPTRGDGVDESVARSRLPPCDLPLFDGDYLQWPSFRDKFSVLVVNNTKITPVEKLFLLNQKTTGEANEIVADAPVTHDGFEMAWKALQDRYENKRVLVNKQFKVLFNLPKVDQESAASVRALQRTIHRCVSILSLYKIDPSERWDAALVFLCSIHLPAVTLGLWEQSLKNRRDIPKWSDMAEFIAARCDTLDSIIDVQQKVHPSREPTTSRQKRVSTNQASTTLSLCQLCPTQSHTIRNCPKFVKMSVNERETAIKKHRLCLNCFAKTHLLPECQSKHSCFTCGKRHHTLLHRMIAVDRPSTSRGASSNSTNSETKSKNANSSALSSITNGLATNVTSVLLGTALIHVIHHGVRYVARALLDSGSQATFVCERFARRLQLPATAVHTQVLGITNSVTAKATKRVSFLIGSLVDPHFQIDIDAFVLPRLCNNLPTSTIPRSSFNALPNIRLADPNFNITSHVDLLIGADLFPHLLLEGLRRNVCGSLLAQETLFGWILTGPMQTTSCQLSVVSCLSEVALDQQITRFWEIEEVSATSILSSGDKYCEELFHKTTKRLPDGRYMVDLPFRETFPSRVRFGHSRMRASTQFVRNEARLLRQPDLKCQYDDVIREYLDEGHMFPVAKVEQHNSNNFYLPHHAVIKPDSSSTKVRVVFNASSCSSNGVSLNDVLYVGPALQADLMILLIRWRFYRFVFNCDIKQMYRQILVNPSHTPFQRILHREDPNEEIRDYELRTVTFGVNCAPYLAIRTLLRLAEDVENQFPLASTILRDHMYVDDVLAGGHDVESAIQSRIEIHHALRSAGFELRKWTANSLSILQDIQPNHRLREDFLQFSDASSAKTLGVRWEALSDNFYFNITPGGEKSHWTKRQVFSQIAKLFDPVGWLAPCVVRAKMLMQQIWLEGTQWDDQLSDSSLQKWEGFQRDLTSAPIIKIPRYIGYSPSHGLELHVFSDASEKAYAASLYTRIKDREGVYTVSLLVAKTRVAPTKTVSLPRLELCGAALAAELVHNILSRLSLKDVPIYGWTDSTIVLAWLQKDPCCWQTFVANRISSIQKILPANLWHHVDSIDNPADVASRGSTLADLRSHDLWWHGPEWLKQPKDSWTTSISTVNPDSIPEAKMINTFGTRVQEFEDILKRFSCLSRALRVTAYMCRFFERTHSRTRALAHFPDINISADEISKIKLRLIKVVQQGLFADDIRSLSNKKGVPSSSSLKSLNPIIDEQGLLRACGRLSAESSLSHDERFPIIIPYECHLARLFVQFTHRISLHGGNQLVLRLVRLQFWIPKLKNMIRAVIRNCKVCVLFRRRTMEQLMGVLPAPRVQFSRPFTHTGVDFAGPFEIRSFSGRACRITKGYVCVFVCFSTKAIHLEVTSDLSAATFLAAFQRFVARRGCPSHVYSDNGRNFVGAARSLAQDFLEVSRTLVIKSFHPDPIRWKFIPPGAPHMGGLWEAGVKSFKTHFLKTVGSFRFTYEEFATLLCRIEACLNSRPLSPMSEDSSDLTALTPGHFLIGCPLLAPPEPVTETEPLSVINRWQRVKALHHQLTNRWKHEYLKELQKRYKWQRPQPDLTPDSLVVVHEDHIPPTEWRLGRVIRVFPGSDNRIRVAEIRTCRGIITRPIVKLVPLPSA